MESPWIQDILNWISANPGWAGFLIFLIAFIESLVVVGFLLPGIFILFGIGTLVGLGGAALLPVWVGGSLGAFAGDIVSFYLGRRFKSHIRDFWPFNRYPRMLIRGTEFFRVHGIKSVVAGRFIGPLRPVIPVTVGMLGMSPMRFMAVSIPACIVWTPAYVLPGMFFGASLEVVSEYAGRLTLVLVILVAVVWLTLWFIRTIYEVFATYSARWMRHAIRWSRRHPVLGRITGPIIDPSQPEVLSVSTLGLLLVLFLWALVMLQFMSPFGNEPGVTDLAALSLAQTLRNEIADPFMVVISQLSRWWVLIPTSLATLLWLLGAQRRSAAAHWLVAMAGGAVLQVLMSWTLKATPLIETSGNMKVYVPSAPMTMTAVVLGFFSIMVAKELHRRHRRWPYLASTLLLTLLVIARIYLGLDWLSGALTGLLLGLAWTAIVGMAYRARALRSFSGGMALLIFYGTLLGTLMFQAAEHLDEDLAALQIPLEEQEIPANLWWQSDWQLLPQERTQVRTVKARAFNVQWGGDLDAVNQAFSREGWEIADHASWQWVLKALNPEASDSTLPLTGKNYLGHREALVLRKPGVEDGKQWVLRFWNSGARLGESGEHVYLGQFTQESLEKRLWLFSYWQARPVNVAELQNLDSVLQKLNWQEVRPGLILIRESPAIP